MEGAVYADEAAPFVGCTFTGNTAATGYVGGGICVNASNTRLINCLLTGNSAAKGGALYNNYNRNLQLVNTTITGNTATQGGGVYNYFENSRGDVVLTTSILWNNAATLGATNERQLFNDVGATSAHKNSLVQDGISPGGTDQGGNLNTDPLFVSATDFQLTPCSPAVDAANSAGYLAAGGGTTDLTGNNRYFGPTLDMGAYELQRARSLALVITTQPAAGSSVCPGTAITAGISVTGAVTNYQWYKGTAPVSGQTTATLSLTNPQPADGGQLRSRRDRFLRPGHHYQRDQHRFQPDGKRANDHHHATSRRVGGLSEHARSGRGNCRRDRTIYLISGTRMG